MTTTQSTTGALTAHRSLGWAVKVAGWALVALLAWFMWPATLGGQTSLVVVSGDSMEPTYSSGDLVVAREGSPQVGDVIVYNPKGYGRAQIVHRVIGGNATGWEVQGDNNDWVDPFTPDDEAIVGVVKLHFGGIGWLTRLLLNPYTWAFAILAALVLLLWFGGSSGCPDQDENLPDDRVDADEPESDAGYITWTLGVGLALSGLLAFVFSTPASASALSIAAQPNLFVQSDANCIGGATLQADVSGAGTPFTYAAAEVQGIPAACAGLPLAITLLDDTGAVLASASGTAVAGTNTFTMSASYNAMLVESVRVDLDFPNLATWVYVPNTNCEVLDGAGSVSTDYGCVATVTEAGANPWTFWGWSGYRYDVDVTWSHTPPAGYRWRATLPLDSAPFPGWTPAWVATQGGNQLQTAPGYACSALPSITVEPTGTAATGRLWISQSTPIIWFSPVLCS